MQFFLYNYNDTRYVALMFRDVQRSEPLRKTGDLLISWFAWLTFWGDPVCTRAGLPEAGRSSAAHVG